MCNYDIPWRCDSDMMLNLVKYTKEFLPLSWKWLNDPEIKNLTGTPDFSKEDQIIFFGSIDSREDYKIFGIESDNIKIGACGLKNIESSKAEYWGYIGEKSCWGKGLGNQLIYKMLIKAKEMGLKKVYLKVSNTNFKAINLYKKFKFIENISLSSNNVIYMEVDI